jgi:hypothetical protein
MRTFIARHRTKTLATAGVVIAVVAAGAGYAAAVGGSGADLHRTALGRGFVAGSTTQGPCKLGYDTETSPLTPPDDSTNDNTPAASVTIKKQCPGAVVATFDGEYNGTGTNDFIHMDLRATCTATGGTSSPCTVGQVVSGQPGHTFLQTGGSPEGTRTAQWVFPGLKRGVWKFEALAGGDNAASLGFRTLTVEAWNGG